MATTRSVETARRGVDTTLGDGGGERTIVAWVALILRRWQMLAALVLAGLTLGAGYSLTQPTLFEARSTLVLSPKSGVLDPNASENLPALAVTIATLTVTDTVLIESAERFAASATDTAERTRRRGLDVDWMKGHVSASVLANTSLVEITARERDAATAAELTEAVIQAAPQKLRSLGSASPSASGLVLTALGEPTGRGQVSPNLMRNLLLGGNLGLVLGLLLAALLSDRGLRIRGQSDVADALGGARVISLPAPLRGGAREGRLGAGDLTVKPDEPLQEPYRLLRSLLMDAAQGAPMTLAVVGPASPTVLRETAVLLGAHVCAAGAPCVVVQADFHGGGWIVEGSARGLGEVLDGADIDPRDLAVPVRRMDSTMVVNAPVGLAILPAGVPPLDPAGALGSPRATALFERLAHEYQHVLVVGPSSDWQAESMMVVAKADATLLVLGEGLSVDEARDIRTSFEAERGRLLAIAVLEARRS